MCEYWWLAFLLCIPRPRWSYYIVDLKVANENSDSETTTDSENSSENPAAENFVVAGIQEDSDIAVVAENCYENFVDSLR